MLCRGESSPQPFNGGQVIGWRFVGRRCEVLAVSGKAFQLFNRFGVLQTFTASAAIHRSKPRSKRWLRLSRTDRHRLMQEARPQHAGPLALTDCLARLKHRCRSPHFTPSVALACFAGGHRLLPTAYRLLRYDDANAFGGTEQAKSASGDDSREEELSISGNGLFRCGRGDRDGRVRALVDRPARW